MSLFNNENDGGLDDIARALWAENNGGSQEDRENPEKRKFELTENTRTVEGKTLYQIRAVDDVHTRDGIVKAGDLGGWVEKVENLSQYGDSWIDKEACVMGDAVVKDNAYVSGEAVVKDQAVIQNDASVGVKPFTLGSLLPFNQSKNAPVIGGNARLEGQASVYGQALVDGDARVTDKAVVKDFAHVTENAQVSGRGIVRDHASVSGEAYVMENGIVEGNAQVKDSGLVAGEVSVGGDWVVGGMTELKDRTYTPFDNIHLKGQGELTTKEGERMLIESGNQLKGIQAKQAVTQTRAALATALFGDVVAKDGQQADDSLDKD